MLLIIISRFILQKDKEAIIKWKLKLPKLNTWKKRRMVVSISCFNIDCRAYHPVCAGCYRYYSNLSCRTCHWGHKRIFWDRSYLLVSYSYWNYFRWEISLRLALCFCACSGECRLPFNCYGNKSKTKKHLNSAFIYIAAFLFWGSIIFNIVMNINNLTFDIHRGNSVVIPVVSRVGFIGALITITPLVMFLIFLWGSRFFCRNVCPIGGLLQLYSKFSFLKIKIDQDKCTDCSACSKNCQMNVNI